MRPRKLDSGYLSNECLHPAHPAVIRCNIEPAAGHLCYLLQCEPWHRNQMKCLTRKNENNSNIDPIEVAIDAGATLSKPASSSISKKRKIHVNEGKYKQRNSTSSSGKGNTTICPTDHNPLAPASACYDVYSNHYDANRKHCKVYLLETL